MMMFGRALSQNGEIERASRCRGIDMLYGGYRVVHEVEVAPQKPLGGQKAYTSALAEEESLCPPLAEYQRATAPLQGR